MGLSLTVSEMWQLKSGFARAPPPSRIGIHYIFQRLLDSLSFYFRLFVRLNVLYIHRIASAWNVRDRALR